MTPARFRWGMLLIFIGIMILLQNFGILYDQQYRRMDIILPIILITIGIEKIFTKSKLQFISYLTTFVLFFGGFALVFNSNDLNFQNRKFTSESIYKESANPSLQLIKANLYLENNDLTIRDAGSDLILAEFDNENTDAQIESFIENNTAIFDIQANDNSYLGGIIVVHNDEPDQWKLKFSEDLPLELSCDGYDNDLRLNFQFSRLQKLTLETENSYINLKIGFNEPFVQVFIRGNDSKLRLRLPEKIGVKLFGNDSLFYTEIGFKQTDEGAFINNNYSQSEKKVNIELDDNLLSFSLDYY